MRERQSRSGSQRASSTALLVFLYGAKYIKLTSSNKCVHRKQTRSTNLISMDVSVCMLKTLHLNVGTMCVCARHNCIWFFKRLFLFFILWTIYCLFLMLSCFFEISEKHVREREREREKGNKKEELWQNQLSQPKST